jgi:hypothetical protein
MLTSSHLELCGHGHGDHITAIDQAHSPRSNVPKQAFAKANTSGSDTQTPDRL